MLKLLIKCGLLLAPLLSVCPATAAKFAVKDISDKQWCWPAAFLQAMQASHPLLPQCTTNPVGTVELVITPEPGELPIKCYDSGNNGNFCMYSADFYIAAYYREAWFNKTGYAWTPVDILRIPAVTAWPPWAGTGSMGYEINVGELNLNTGKFDPPLEGIEVYAGIAPAGSAVFAPGMVAKIYPVSTP